MNTTEYYKNPPRIQCKEHQHNKSFIYEKYNLKDEVLNGEDQSGDKF